MVMGKQKQKRPLNCCNSSTARRVSENTASSVFSLSERPPKRKHNFSLYLKMIGGIEMNLSVCKSAVFSRPKGSEASRQIPPCNGL